jgi:hypothetical protein
MLLIPRYVQESTINMKQPEWFLRGDLSQLRWWRTRASGTPPSANPLPPINTVPDGTGYSGDAQPLQMPSAKALLQWPAPVSSALLHQSKSTPSISKRAKVCALTVQERRLIWLCRKHPKMTRQKLWLWAAGTQSDRCPDLENIEAALFHFTGRRK